MKLPTTLAHLWCGTKQGFSEALRSFSTGMGLEGFTCQVEDEWLGTSKKGATVPKVKGFFKQLSSWRFLRLRSTDPDWVGSLIFFNPSTSKIECCSCKHQKVLKAGFCLTKKTCQNQCFFSTKTTMKKNTTLEEKEAKAAGKFRGFRVEILCASLEELDKLLPHLGKSLEVGTGVRKCGFSHEKRLKRVCPRSVILHLRQ